MTLLKIVALFLWLLVPLGAWMALETWGTPHLVVSYRFYDNGDRYNPWAQRHYTDCAYWCVHGVIQIPAQDAKCPWVRMMKVGS